MVINIRLDGTQPATAGNWGTAAGIADRAYVLVDVKERHATAGSDGGAVTVMIKKASSGTAMSGGTDMLASGLNMKATADTNQSGTLHATRANRRIAKGQAFGAVLTGTPTAIAGACITLVFKPLESPTV